MRGFLKFWFADRFAALAGLAGAVEVVDDFDLLLGVEHLPGLFGEAVRDGRDAAGAFGGVLDDGREVGVAAHERDVGAVQGGDDARGVEVLLAADLPGQQRGGGVGDGVVDVDDVQLVLVRHFNELHGQGQRVVGVLEQFVFVELHLMEVNVGVLALQAEGWFVHCARLIPRFQ